MTRNNTSAPQGHRRNGQWDFVTKSEATEPLVPTPDPTNDVDEGYYRPREGEYNPRFLWYVAEDRGVKRAFPQQRNSSDLAPGETFDSQLSVSVNDDGSCSWSVSSTKNYWCRVRGESENVNDAIREAEAASARYVMHVSEGGRSPWGTIDNTEQVIPGVVFASTASHGGVRVSPALNKEIPPALRRRSGWYEEDCEIHIPMMIHHPDPQRREESAREVQRWFPNEWSQWNSASSRARAQR